MGRQRHERPGPAPGPRREGSAAHTGDDAASPFPTGALDAVETTFLWLCTRPHPVTVDGRSIPGLPAAHLPLDELRSVLLDALTPAEVRNRTWAWLIRRARTGGPSWTVACAGMARPLLSGLGAELTRRYAGDPADIYAEVLTGFLTGLAVVDPDRAPLPSLRWAAWRAGHAALIAALDAPRPVCPHTIRAATGTPAPASTATREPGPAKPGNNQRRHTDGHTGGHGEDEAGAGRMVRCESSPPPRPPGHPDFVLADAVAAGVLTVAEAALIGSTRLEDLTLAQAASALGRSLSAVTSTRYRAEGRLATHLAAPTPPDGHDEPAGTAEPAGRENAARRRPRPSRSRRPCARSAVRARAAYASHNRRPGTTTESGSPESGSPEFGRAVATHAASLTRRRRHRPRRSDPAAPADWSAPAPGVTSSGVTPAGSGRSGDRRDRRGVAR